MAHGQFKARKKKGESQEERDARLAKQQIQRRADARERHWRKTGVSAATVDWMKDHELL